MSTVADDANNAPEKLYNGTADANERRRLKQAVVTRHASRVANLARALLPTSSTEQREEAAQAGIVGLLEALESYDPTRGVSFWTYAYHHVRDEIRNWIEVGIYWRKTTNRGKSAARARNRAAAEIHGRQASLDALTIELEADAPTPEDLVLRAELSWYAGRFLQTLTAEEREVAASDDGRITSSRHHKILVARARAAFAAKKGSARE